VAIYHTTLFIFVQIFQVKADALAKFASSSMHKLKVYGGSVVDLRKAPGGRGSSKK
jgi:hypothetical protein